MTAGAGKSAGQGLNIVYALTLPGEDRLTTLPF
jgi:hypothetical protein